MAKIFDLDDALRCAAWSQQLFGVTLGSLTRTISTTPFGPIAYRLRDGMFFFKKHRSRLYQIYLLKAICKSH
jgi:hypothetical protein